MVKIRINELARELEVKPNVILDMLPELGVTEKKTHSSSVDEPVAIEIKRRLTEESNGSRGSRVRRKQKPRLNMQPMQAPPSHRTRPRLPSTNR